MIDKVCVTGHTESGYNPHIKRADGLSSVRFVSYLCTSQEPQSLSTDTEAFCCLDAFQHPAQSGCNLTTGHLLLLH